MGIYFSIKELADEVQAGTDAPVYVAYVDQGYTGVQQERDTRRAGIELIMARFPEPRICGGLPGHTFAKLKAKTAA